MLQSAPARGNVRSPCAPAVFPENVPPELAERGQWVGWRLRPRPGGGKPAKVPVCPASGRAADVADPDTWGEFGRSLDVFTDVPLDGIGYVFAEGDPFAGIDLDGCRDPGTGQLDPWAEELVAEFRTYAEVSPSSTGVKMWVRGVLPGPGLHRGNIEAYDRGRYFTVTGRRLPGVPEFVETRPDALRRLYGELAARRDIPPARPPTGIGGAPSGLADDMVVRRAEAAKNGDKFARLWAGDWSAHPSPSEADIALVGILAFWSGDPTQVDRLFRRSGLMRAKWDEARGALTYGQRTIARDLRTRTEFYGPGERGLHSNTHVGRPIGSGLLSGGTGQGQDGPTMVGAWAASDGADPPATVAGEHPRVQRLAVLCRQLQRIHGDAPFFLGCREAGELLGVSHTLANDHLARLRDLRVIVRTFRGTKRSARSSEYRYLGARSGSRART